MDDPRKLYRTTDPNTSRAAAEHIYASLGDQHAKCAVALSRIRDANADELSDIVGFLCWRRINELVAKGWAYYTGDTRVMKSGLQGRVVAFKWPEETKEIGPKTSSDSQMSFFEV